MNAKPRDDWHWTIDLRIASERGAGHDIIQQVMDRLEDEGWPAHDLFSIRLALEEAIVNAIEHGNQLDRDKEVHVVCKLSERRLWIAVEDEGPGFDPNAVPDPTDPDRLEIPSGRGIMLMCSYMNRVEFNDTGNAVIMEKQRAN